MVIIAETQKVHPSFVDVRQLEAENARVEIDHLGQIAAVQTDVSDLVDADRILGFRHSSYLRCKHMKNDMKNGMKLPAPL